MISTITSIAILFSFPLNTNSYYKRIKLIPSGENFVFKLNTNGVVVTGTYDVISNNVTYNPSSNDIKKGDVIVEANNKKITKIDDLSSLLKDSSKVSVKIKRKEEFLYRDLYIYKVNNIARSGLYVKDRVIGVGTLTYIDPSSMTFGGLGHEVIDNDTSSLVDLSSGEIYANEVISITKGTNMHPGEKVSNTSFDNKIGNVLLNTKYGMFGNYYKSISSYKSYEMAYKNEIKKGEAEILTCVKGSEVRSYKIDITSLKKQDNQGTKGISFKITDEELLSLSGGVYSGMSGSPIIQNNRIIGAVTHVLVDNIQYGYGIYIDNMYNKLNK